MARRVCQWLTISVYASVREYQWLLPDRSPNGVADGRFKPRDTCDRAGTWRSVDARPEQGTTRPAPTRCRGRVFRDHQRAPRRLLKRTIHRQQPPVQIPANPIPGTWSIPGRFCGCRRGIQACDQPERAAWCLQRTSIGTPQPRVRALHGGFSSHLVSVRAYRSGPLGFRRPSASLAVRSVHASPDTCISGCQPCADVRRGAVDSGSRDDILNAC